MGLESVLHSDFPQNPDEGKYAEQQGVNYDCVCFCVPSLYVVGPLPPSLSLNREAHHSCFNFARAKRENKTPSRACGEDSDRAAARKD